MRLRLVMTVRGAVFVVMRLVRLLGVLGVGGLLLVACLGCAFACFACRAAWCRAAGAGWPVAPVAAWRPDVLAACLAWCRVARCFGTGFGAFCVWMFRLADAAGAATPRTGVSCERSRIAGRTIAATSAAASGIATRAEVENPKRWGKPSSRFFERSGLAAKSALR